MYACVHVGCVCVCVVFEKVQYYEYSFCSLQTSIQKTKPHREETFYTEAQTNYHFVFQAYRKVSSLNLPQHIHIMISGGVA